MSLRAFACAAAGWLLVAPACSAERHLIGLAEEEDEGRAAGGAGGSGGVGGSDGPAHDVADDGPDADAPDDRPDGELDAGMTVPELWSELVTITCEKMRDCCTPEEKVKNTLAA